LATTRRRAFLAPAFLLLFAWFASAAHADPSCTFDPSTRTVTAIAQPGGDAWMTEQVVNLERQIFFTSGGQVLDCGTSVSEADRIDIVGSGSTTLTIDATNGVYGPGRTPEGRSVDEVEMSMTGFTSLVYDAPFDFFNTIIAGDRGLNVNGDNDADITYPGITSLLIWGGGVDDVVSAHGGSGTGHQLPSGVHFQYNSIPPLPEGGHHTITGHDGPDFLGLTFAVSATVQGLGGDDILLGGLGAGTFSLDGGPGNDTIQTGGAPTTAHGGTGDDTLILQGNDSAFGDKGRDLFRAANTVADTIDGGPGRDSAIVDPVDTVTDVETVN
jgi:Ca2+-binding RTX toxin-like protein